MDARKIREFAKREFPDSVVIKNYCRCSTYTKAYGIHTKKYMINSVIIGKLNLTFKRWFVYSDENELVVMVYLE